MEKLTVTNCRTFRGAAFHWLLPDQLEKNCGKCHKNYLRAGLQRHWNCRFGSLELPKLLLWTMLITNTRYLVVKTINLIKSFVNTDFVISNSLIVKWHWMSFTLWIWFRTDSNATMLECPNTTLLQHQCYNACMHHTSDLLILQYYHTMLAHLNAPATMLLYYIAMLMYHSAMPRCDATMLQWLHASLQ